jgi:hypothetical protein
MTTPTDKLQRELDLRYEIQTRLPDFVSACEGDTEAILMHQDAFAPDYGEEEFALLGRAIKFAGLFGKDVTITARR